MPDECRCVVLWYPCPLTLGDEPLPCGMEHRARELGIGVSEPVFLDFDDETGEQETVNCDETEVTGSMQLKNEILK